MILNVISILNLECSWEASTFLLHLCFLLLFESQPSMKIWTFRAEKMCFQIGLQIPPCDPSKPRRGDLFRILREPSDRGDCFRSSIVAANSRTCWRGVLEAKCLKCCRLHIAQTFKTTLPSQQSSQYHLKIVFVVHTTVAHAVCPTLCCLCSRSGGTAGDGAHGVHPVQRCVCWWHLSGTRQLALMVRASRSACTAAATALVQRPSAGAETTTRRALVSPHKRCQGYTLELIWFCSTSTASQKTHAKVGTATYRAHPYSMCQNT